MIVEFSETSVYFDKTRNKKVLVLGLAIPIRNRINPLIYEPESELRIRGLLSLDFGFIMSGYFFYINQNVPI